MQASKGNTPKCDGISLVPLLTGADKKKQRAFYWEHGNVQAYRNGDWKLLRFKKKDGIVNMLFNLKVDPNETTNLADQLPDRVAKLTAEAMESRVTSNDFPSFLDKE